jgi:serine/threonine-protein kinase
LKNLLTERTLTSDWHDPESRGAPATLQVGSTLGPFLVRELLGHGGMGVVYAATHRETGAEVALKTLQRVDSRAATRLKSEFRHLARIRHPRLVQLFELHTIDQAMDRRRHSLDR